jgi:hypothetical protein
MFNDIARENRLRDRLEELRMLSVSGDEMCVSGSFENKEGAMSYIRGLFGGGKAKVVPESQNDATQNTTSTVAEDPSVSNLRTREDEVKQREDRVTTEEKSLQERQDQYEKVERRMYKEREATYKDMEERMEVINKREREHGMHSLHNVMFFDYFYRDTMKRILIDEKRERCTIPKLLTEWFVDNWKGCGSVWRNTCESIWNESLKITGRTGVSDSEKDEFQIHVRPYSQRVVIFYIKSKLYAYMKEKNISSERALFELHKNMSYDDKYPDTKEDKDIWQVDASEIQLDVLPGEIP